MSYKSLVTKGYELSEATQQQYIDISMAAYRAAKEEIDTLLAKTYAKLSGVEPINYWAELTKYQRYQTLSEEIGKAYKATSTAAGKATETGLSAAMAENYNRQLFLTEWLAPGIGAVPIDKNLLKYSVTGNIKYWKEIKASVKDKLFNQAFYSPQAGTLSQLLTKNYTAELDRILQAVQNGFITGKSYSAQSMAIREIIGKYIKGDDAATGAMYNALRIARTEGQRVLNAGALQAAKEAEAQGIDIKKQWLAALDSRTRTSHQALDGKRKKLDENFVSPTTGAKGPAPGKMSKAGDNINCRCTTINIVDGEEPAVRRARDPVTGENSVIDFKSYDEWIKAL